MVPKLDLPAFKLDGTGLIIHSVTSRRHCLSSANRISRLICRRYLDRICTSMSISRFQRVSSCFSKLRNNNMMRKTEGLNSIVFCLRRVFLESKTRSFKYGFGQLKLHSKFGQTYRLKKAQKRHKAHSLNQVFSAWKRQFSDEKRVRNEQVIKGLLFSKLKLTYGA